MKAVVVELNNDRAAVLSDDGCIITVKNKNYTIGTVIQIKDAYVPLTRKLGALAASAAAFVILGTGLWAYASPYAYVSVDVNPSIEFSVNRFDRVIHVNGVNDDGKKILKDISLDHLKNKTIKEALESTVDEITDAGYFDGVGNGGIVIAASCADIKAADQLADRLEQTVKQITEENGDTVEVEAFQVGPERVKEAKKLGVTPGKLHLVEKLQEAAGISDTINTDEWLHKPVKDIMKATTDYKEAAKKAEAASGDAGTASSPVKDKASNSPQKEDNHSKKAEKETGDPKADRDTASEADSSDHSSVDKTGKSNTNKESSSDITGKQSKGTSDTKKKPGIHKKDQIDKKPSSGTKSSPNKETDNDTSVNHNPSDIIKGNGTVSEGNTEETGKNTNSAPESNKAGSENSNKINRQDNSTDMNNSNLQTNDGSQTAQNESGNNTEAKNSSGNHDNTNDNKAAGTDNKDSE